MGPEAFAGTGSDSVSAGNTASRVLLPLGAVTRTTVGASKLSSLAPDP